MVAASAAAVAVSKKKKKNYHGWLKERKKLRFILEEMKIMAKMNAKNKSKEELRVVQNYVHFVRVHNSTVQLCTSTLTRC